MIETKDKVIEAPATREDCHPNSLSTKNEIPITPETIAPMKDIKRSKPPINLNLSCRFLCLDIPHRINSTVDNKKNKMVALPTQARTVDCHESEATALAECIMIDYLSFCCNDNQKPLKKKARPSIEAKTRMREAIIKPHFFQADFFNKFFHEIKIVT